MSVEEVAPGWEDRWKVFHRPVRAGVFWIGPPWEAPPAEAVPVVIDPGRAFGTGAHPTTRLCVEVLPELDGGDLVDVGCGSGVVAIAAAILGFRPVVAVDVDPAAIEATGRNAAANGVAVETFVADGTASGVPSADVAVVNIGLAVVEQVAKRIECDVVVTAGYLDPERPSLPRFAHVRRRVLGGWAADVWTRTARS